MTVVHIVVERGLTRHSASIYCPPSAWISSLGSGAWVFSTDEKPVGAGEGASKTLPRPTGFVR